MKRLCAAVFVFAASVVILASCGGGGGGGPSRVVTKLYLFGSMSSNTNIAHVYSNISTAGFKDYSAPNGITTGTFPLRSGILKASGSIKVSVVDATFNTANKRLSIQLVNGAYDNLSSSTTKNSGKGTEIATLNMSPGTVLLPTDKSPNVGKFRLTPAVVTDYLNGCMVNYAP